MGINLQMTTYAVMYGLPFSYLPVIVDPSHATAKRHLVGSMSLVAVADGAEGLFLLL